MNAIRLRRDPRAERAARLVPGNGRLRYDMSATPYERMTSPSGRLRRDPRAERQRLLTTGRDGRARLVRSGLVGQMTGISTASARTVKKIRVEKPEFFIVVVPDLPDGRLDRADRQLLGAARKLADGGEGAIVVVGAAVDAPSLGQAGADRILPLADGSDPDARVAELVAVMEALSPRHVLIPESEEGADLARRLAARTRLGLLPGIEVLGPKQAIRPCGAGRQEWAGGLAPLMTLAPDRVPAWQGEEHEILPLEKTPVPSGPVQARMRVGAIRSPDPATMNLGDAPFVVAAGRGVTDFESFRATVKALHATPGASRVVCDNGDMPRATQVGASGTILDALCYVAMGIAGAPQHLQGLGRVEHVVAVNTDLHAAMVSRAGLAIIADAQAVMPVLCEILAAEYGEKRP
ncbi:electron transfer flavoprotein subunit alpha/FixB family protein [Acetobacter conturbans]|uniref:Electron transfer flavoprotein subunit alpha/FixB family protein n=1 Tax=Acetobacter conturbans TaxID=1737472 RepID=A0ABX0K3V3_9PROT|nr:electron transfer flavoprotein subunit alpha/FixB family protein [Acetobacter conturbans]NHN88998.1 electron transfer flavoprotein subunit alpha/FixB family protein [Acetobacter conturbans]